MGIAHLWAWPAAAELGVAVATSCRGCPTTAATGCCTTAMVGGCCKALAAAAASRPSRRLCRRSPGSVPSQESTLSVTNAAATSARAASVMESDDPRTAAGPSREAGLLPARRCSIVVLLPGSGARGCPLVHAAKVPCCWSNDKSSARLALVSAAGASSGSAYMMRPSPGLVRSRRRWAQSMAAATGGLLPRLSSARGSCWLAVQSTASTTRSRDSCWPFVGREKAGKAARSTSALVQTCGGVGRAGQKVGRHPHITGCLAHPSSFPHAPGGANNGAAELQHPPTLLESSNWSENSLSGDRAGGTSAATRLAGWAAAARQQAAAATKSSAAASSLISRSTFGRCAVQERLASLQGLALHSRRPAGAKRTPRLLALVESHRPTFISTLRNST